MIPRSIQMNISGIIDRVMHNAISLEMEYTCVVCTVLRYPRYTVMAVERSSTVCPGCDLLTGFHPRVCEVNRPRDKGWRLTSAVIRFCGSATMVIERDNERAPTCPRKCAGEMLDLLLRRSPSTIPRHRSGILDDVRAWMFQRDICRNSVAPN